MVDEKVAGQEQQKTNDFRDAAGRFSKGNPGGPGNPFARFTADLRKAFAEEATPDDLKKVARAMLDKAQEGDVGAARVVLSYTLGKPLEAVDPDRLDELECSQWMNESVNGEQVSEVIRGMGATMFAQFLRGVIPILSHARWQALADGLTSPVAPEKEQAEAPAENKSSASTSKSDEPKKNPVGARENSKETVTEVDQASREAMRQARALLDEGQILPIKPIADNKRSSGNGRAANPGKPDGGNPAG